jgi:3-oxoacyl-[acyl-carrier-protein] synthase-1
MQKSTIIKRAQILCALGNIEKTVESLSNGKSGIIPDPCYGINVPYAPFPDKLPRTIDKIISGLNFPIQNQYKSLLFIFSAAKGNLSDLEDNYHKKDNSSAKNVLLETQMKRAIDLLGINPSKSLVISAACASGSVAIDYAKECLTLGLFSDVLIFGYDIVTEFFVKGFNSLSALSPQSAKPFDKSRNGLTLGDGAAILHLTYDSPQSGDIIIGGTGTSNDANHRTGPSRTGEGLLRAIQNALIDGSYSSDQIGAVKCHGTATNYNDAMEAKALFSCFNNTIPPCVSFKGAIGHSSGAGSLLEIVIAAEFLKRRYVPPTIGFETKGIDEPLPVSSQLQHFTKNTILCLSAGFGGLNAAVVIQEYN